MTQAQEQAKEWQVRKKRGCPAASKETAFARLRAFPAEVAPRGAGEFGLTHSPPWHRLQGYNSSNSDGDSDDDEPNSKRSRKSGGAQTSQHQPDSRAPARQTYPSTPPSAKRC